MNTLIIIIFIVTYAGIAFGGIPRLALDRTGIALLGAIAMIISGAVSMADAAGAVDISTIVLLYSLMVLSSQFRLGGFYTWTALKITKFMEVPERFLFIMMLISAGLSAVLANDIVCLAFTPVLTVSLLRAGLNPVPFLIGLAASSNIGSAATIIGNPQNMLIGQTGRLDFGHFFIWCAPPSILSLAVAYIIIRSMYRNSLRAAQNLSLNVEETWPSFDSYQSIKGATAAAVLMILFFTGIPREISALTVAGLLLCSRKIMTRSILGLVDWHLITLFCALFIVIRGLEIAHLPETIIELFKTGGIDMQNPITLTAVAAGLSNIVSNVPAVMLLTKFLDTSNHMQWYVLALSSTFAGNLVTIGSIANIITFEQASRYGVNITFMEHARTGIPVTLASLFIAIIWVWLSSYF